MSETNVTTRLEAFSDAMLAIIITIMVLELKTPEHANWASIWEIRHELIAYVMSFLFVGVYWGNHHHLIHTVKKLSSGVLLTNLNLLFWLSLVPFATGWMAKTEFEPLTVAVYAVLLNVCGLSYTFLQKSIERTHRDNEHLKRVMKRHTRKGIFSIISYGAAVPLAYVNSYISLAIFFLVAIVWLVPDKQVFEVSS